METWWVTHESMSHPGADLPADLALAWLASLPPRCPAFSTFELVRTRRGVRQSVVSLSAFQSIILHISTPRIARPGAHRRGLAELT